MARTSYQYGTSPRKYEPEYTKIKTTKKINKSSKVNKPKNIETEKKMKIDEKKKKANQIIVVLAIFAMLLTISYREIAIMEMFNEKKELEGQLAVIEKENGQVEKNIKEVESTLDWNKIKQVATEELGMQTKAGIPLDLEKTDFVETKDQFIIEEKTSVIEKIVSFIINR